MMVRRSIIKFAVVSLLTSASSLTRAQVASAQDGSMSEMAHMRMGPEIVIPLLRP